MSSYQEAIQHLSTNIAIKASFNNKAYISPPLLLPLSVSHALLTKRPQDGDFVTTQGPQININLDPEMMVVLSRIISDDCHQICFLSSRHLFGYNLRCTLVYANHYTNVALKARLCAQALYPYIHFIINNPSQNHVIWNLEDIVETSALLGHTSTCIPPSENFLSLSLSVGKVP